MRNEDSRSLVAPLMMAVVALFVRLPAGKTGSP